MHPVAKARKPFGLFLDIMDFKCVALDGKPEDSGDPMYLRFDSRGRLFRKCKDTNGVWERIPNEELAKWFREFRIGETASSP